MNPINRRAWNQLTDNHEGTKEARRKDRGLWIIDGDCNHPPPT
jgi:hypothetical protein